MSSSGETSPLAWSLGLTVSADGLAAFVQVVVDDLDLQHELLAAGDDAEFVPLVVQRATDAGYDVSADDVEHGLRDRRRAWRTQWI